MPFVYFYHTQFRLKQIPDVLNFRHFRAFQECFSTYFCNFISLTSFTRLDFLRFSHEEIISVLIHLLRVIFFSFSIFINNFIEFPVKTYHSKPIRSMSISIIISLIRHIRRLIVFSFSSENRFIMSDFSVAVSHPIVCDLNVVIKWTVSLLRPPIHIRHHFVSESSTTPFTFQRIEMVTSHRCNRYFLNHIFEHF